MPYIPTILILALLSLTDERPDSNPLYHELRTQGLSVGTEKLVLPEPSLPDGQPAEAGLAALRDVAGGDRPAREMLRDSVTAPFILKTRDVKTEDAIIRVADLWFVVHARLEDVDLDSAARAGDQKAIEAGNMRFESRILTDPDLRERGIKPLDPLEGRSEWFTHLTGRLLDRIEVVATDRVVATRTPESLLVAARTEPAFSGEGATSNHWRTLAKKGNDEIEGPIHPYTGAISYVKVTRLVSEPGVLFVEAHFAFVEPRDWFQGNPILRSKISLIAQDQIRQLRRELQKSQSRE
ncbi:hypothetical protein P12x_001816 [Tundrisphaera lichenicola]|uniref:hypothetical protein n=1 Tax=Tundrisphaera lichenicola TaxID=2029860 RepID=UPI003EBBAFF9